MMTAGKIGLREAVILAGVIILAALAFLITGCAFEAEKKGLAVTKRELSGMDDSPGKARALSIVDALIKVKGEPSEAILPVTSPDAEKDKEAASIVKEIEEQSNFFGGLFGGWFGTIASVGASIAGIGYLAYTGRWALAGRQLISLVTEGVQKGRVNGWTAEELKDHIAANTEGKWYKPFLDKYVGKAKLKIGTNGTGPTSGPTRNNT